MVGKDVRADVRAGWWVASGLVCAVVLAGVTGCGTTASTAAPATAAAPTTTASPTTTAPSTTAADPATTPAPGPSGAMLPVSVQSDAEMRAAGNAGPSSSILVPATCELVGATVTAIGSYQGGFAPEVYARYGDIVDLYAFTAPQAGFPEGLQVAEPAPSTSPSIAGNGTWRVSEPVDTTLGTAVRCTVAAQPTHDFQGAP